MTWDEMTKEILTDNDRVAFPARFNVLGGVEKPKGEITWTHNPELSSTSATCCWSLAC
jgi:hypothetical protein